MVWHVQRDESDCGMSSCKPTGKVLVAADYELLDDNEAVTLAEAIWDVAHRRAYYLDEGGGRYATQEEYDLSHQD